MKKHIYEALNAVCAVSITYMFLTIFNDPSFARRLATGIGFIAVFFRYYAMYEESIKKSDPQD